MKLSSEGKKLVLAWNKKRKSWKRNWRTKTRRWNIWEDAYGSRTFLCDLIIMYSSMTKITRVATSIVFSFVSLSSFPLWVSRSFVCALISMSWGEAKPFQMISFQCYKSIIVFEHFVLVNILSLSLKLSCPFSISSLYFGKSVTASVWGWGSSLQDLLSLADSGGQQSRLW